MSHNPLISVIVPVYKVEKYLYTCVDSILKQTYQNLEIILVDDGSPDTCGSLCDRYAAQDPRIRVIHKPNGGLSDARNAGLQIATGEYVGFVDSDDYIAPDMYRILFEAITAHDAQVAVCDSHNVCESESKLFPFSQGNATVYTGNDSSYALFTGAITHFAWNKLYKRSLFDTIAFPIGKIYEDLFTTYRILQRCQKVVHTNTALYFYRVRNDSIMGKARKIIHVDKFQAFDEIAETYREEPFLYRTALTYMRKDLMADVFKIIAGDTIRENEAFFRLLRQFKKAYGLDLSKESLAIWLAIYQRKLLTLRYKLQTRR